MKYVIMARWWNGHDWETVRKDVKDKKGVIAIVGLLLREIMPYQISISDTEKEPGRAKAVDGLPVRKSDGQQSAARTETPPTPETPAPLVICDKVDENCHCWHGTPHVWMGGIYGGCTLSCFKGRDRSMCVPVKAPSKEGRK